MDRSEYQTLFELEGSYWWFRGLHGVLLDTCRRLPGWPALRVLDAGCGTGKLAEVLAREAGGGGYAFDMSPAASDYWKLRGLTRVCRASANAIPFHDDSFDAVMAIDVLECDEVSEAQGYRELWRVTRPGGHLILVVPAFRWLMSPDHHLAVGASRRYTRAVLREVLARAPVQLVRVTYLFASVFMPVALYRTWRRLRGPSGVVRSELRRLPAVVNELLSYLVAGERRVLALTDLPVGSSILAVVQKARA